MPTKPTPANGRAEQKPGPGRPRLDWEQAFASYAALPPQKRSYAAVAAEYGVSPRTVERHGREQRWRHRLGEIELEVAASTQATLAQQRIEQVERTVRLIEATKVGYAEKLRRGEIRMVPGDLEKLNRLLEQLTAEPAVPSANLTGPQPLNVPHPRSPERVADVVTALAESGALAALGLQPIPPAESESEAA